MSTPLSLIAQGSFISTGNPTTVELPKQSHYFLITNRSTWGANPNARVQSWWYNGFSNGQSSGILETGAGVLNSASDAAGGAGFTPVNLSDQDPGALIATGTAITAASPAVVSDVNTPGVGNIVRMINTTGMFQIAGLDFTVTAVNAGTDYTLGYLPAASFGVPASNADYRIIPEKYYSPTKRWITDISNASEAVITMSVAHNYFIGDIVRVHCPDEFGMTQIDGLVGNIISVSPGTITVDINSGAFTPFSFPSSVTASAGVSFPHVVPVGEIATKLTSAINNIGYYGMYLDLSVVGANTNIMDWMAYSRDYTI